MIISGVKKAWQDKAREKDRNNTKEHSKIKDTEPSEGSDADTKTSSSEGKGDGKDRTTSFSYGNSDKTSILAGIVYLGLCVFALLLSIKLLVFVCEPIFPQLTEMRFPKALVVGRERSLCEEVRKVPLGLSENQTHFNAIPLSKAELPKNAYGFDSPPCGAELATLPGGCLRSIGATNCLNGGGACGQEVFVQAFWTAHNESGLFSDAPIRPFRSWKVIKWVIGERFPFEQIPAHTTHILTWVVRENGGGLRLLGTSGSCTYPMAKVQY
jgi:hypothetical protein